MARNSVASRRSCLTGPSTVSMLSEGSSTWFETRLAAGLRNHDPSRELDFKKPKLRSQLTQSCVQLEGSFSF